MKQILLFPLLLAFVITSFAQEEIHPFVRVYNLAGEKINKGHVIRVTDTSLQLNGKSVDIPVRNIGFIKTKRSAGHNVLVGSLIGATTLAVFGAIAGDPDPEYYDELNKVGYAIVGAVFGLAAGAAIGGLTALAKNPDTYLINGDISKWKAFQSMITGKDN
jgi:hypothetical protein